MIEALRDKMINKRSPIPLYYQLKEILREYIRDQEAHTPLPSESELCDHFQISRPTVRQAMSELAQEGALYRSKGRGSFVAQGKIDRDFVLWRGGFNDEIRNRGSIPETRVLELKEIVPDDRIATRLGLNNTGRVAFLRRLRLVDSDPVLVLNTFIELQRVPGFLEKGTDLATRSLHKMLESDYGYVLQRTRRALEAMGAPAAEAELLEIRAGEAVQYFENTVFLADGSIIEYSEGWYRGNRMRFTFEYNLQSEIATRT